MIDAAPEAVYHQQVFSSFLPVWVAVFPIITGMLLYGIKNHQEKLRHAASVLISLAVFGAVLYLFPMVRHGVVEYRMEGVMQAGLLFRLDLIGWIFAFLISGIWLLATIFSLTYMGFEHARRRYYSILILTLGATLGVVCSGDFLTLFLFFELMTLSSYVLVIHEQDKHAMEAGTLYLYLGVAGGLSLLLAIFLLFSKTGTLEIVPLLSGLGRDNIWIFILFLLGFGIKAGVVPLHIWLPKAHPVAPSPASALLSGIMIKAGAYGILRVALVIFAPSMGTESRASLLGLFLLWLGIVTMFLGAFMALFQKNIKRILAYSSVSQMGYIIMGVGIAAAFYGKGGAMGYAGAIYHIFNHALFKAGLFMMVGTVYMLTRELDMDRLGGMARKMPLVAFAFLVAACGIAGIPGFNGFPSKTLLHDGLLYAIKDYGHLNIIVAEKIFTVTSALTVCYFIKLFRGVFLGPLPPQLDRAYNLSLPVKLVMGTFSAAILTIGIFPNLVLEKLILPSAGLLSFYPKYVDYMFGFRFFEWHPLEAMVVVLLLAVCIYIFEYKWRFFSWNPPRWLSVEFLIYRPVTTGLMNFVCRSGPLVDLLVNSTYYKLGDLARTGCSFIGTVDSTLDDVYERSGRTAYNLAERTRQFDGAINQAYERTGRSAYSLADRTSQVDNALNRAYERTGETAQELVKGSSRLDKVLNQAYEKTGQAAHELVKGGHRLDQAIDGVYEKTEKAVRQMSDPEKVSKVAGESSKWNPFEWNIKNLNFDTLIIALVLSLILFILFYYGT